MFKPSLSQLCLYFVKLGLFVFGGPLPLANAMERDLIQSKRWFPEETFREGLALAQLAPGPMATQLAIYFGWAHSGILGATLVGTSFVLPPFFIVVLISILYVQFGTVHWIQSLFYGFSSAIVAVIAVNGFKLIQRTTHKDKLLFMISVISAVIVAITQKEPLLLLLLSGIFVVLFKMGIKNKGTKLMGITALPIFLFSSIHGPATLSELTNLCLYFIKAGTFIFGTGLVIVPFLHSGVVHNFHWLTEQQFLDAVAVGTMTPGPIVITVAFIGYLAAGMAGAILSTFGMFFPCYFFTILFAPFFRKLNQVEWIKNFIIGLTAAAIGSIGGVTYILGKNHISDAPTFLIFIGVLVGLLKFKRVPEPLWLAIAGVAGLVLKLST